MSTPTASRCHYAVAEPVIGYVIEGYVDSNTYVGSSRALATLYTALTIQPEDEIHDLPGGLFLVREGACVGEMHWRLPEKHLFERGPEPQDECPVERLVLAEGTPVTYTRREAHLTMEQARRVARAYGRGPVWVIDEEGPTSG